VQEGVSLIGRSSFLSVELIRIPHKNPMAGTLQGGSGAAAGLNPPEELPIELLHGELVCSGILAPKDGDPVSYCSNTLFNIRLFGTLVSTH
jgi:hypothetical protein